MKAQFLRFLTIFYAILVTFTFTVALTAMAAGCGDDEEDTGEGTDEVTEDGNKNPAMPGTGSSDPSKGSADDMTDDDSSEGDEDDASIEEDEESSEESEDDGEDDDEADEEEDDGDDTETGEGADDTEADEDGDDTEGAAGNNGVADDRLQCTQDDLSECSDINITGGLIPMEVCCTEDGFCGGDFMIAQGFTTGCLSDQLPDPPITKDCEQCASTNCSNAFSECQNNAVCDTLSNCLMTCTDLMSCVTCVGDNPDGWVAYGTLAACALTECTTTCTDQFIEFLPPGLLGAFGVPGGGGNFGGGVPGGGFPGGGGF